MRQILLFCCSIFLLCNTYAQDISVRVRMTSFSAVDPDGAGPANGSVTFKFELKSSSGDVLADGMGLSVVYQSANLMATPANTVLKLGPINTALWTHQVDNRAGNTIAPVSYGGISFDKRMIITFNQNVGVPDAVIGTTWTEVAQLTYYTLGAGLPQGGFIVPEPGSVVAQNELSSDGGFTTYPYLSPEVGTPLALGSSASPLPVHFVQFDAQCSPGGNNLTWSTANEKDNNYFEVQKSTDGSSWSGIGRVNGSGNTNSVRAYQFTDKVGGTAQYRIKQVDLNGEVSYSTIAQTSCNTSSIYVNLYPVPARDRLTLVVGLDKTIKANVYVVDNSGRVVMNIPLSISRGTNNFILDVSHLPQGQYYLQSKNSEVKISHRFSIVR
jgi:hypothetical protein